VVLKKFPNFEVILRTYKLVLLSLKIGTIYRIYLGGVSLYFFAIMAGYLRGYDYEPEYTTEELDELSRAAVTTGVLHLKTCMEFRKHNHR